MEYNFNQLPKKNEVLVFQPYGGVSEKHFALSLEIIDFYTKMGANVRVLSCDSKLKPCSYNLKGCKQTCITCTSKFKHGLSLLEDSNKVNVRNFKSVSTLDLMELSPRFYTATDVHDLKKIYYSNFPIGQGVASILISHFRDPNLLIDNLGLRGLVVNLAKSSFEVYFSMLEHLKIPTDICFFFNGRLPEFKAVQYACEDMNVDYGVFEYGATLDRFGVFFNHTPHDLKKMNQLIFDFWDHMDYPQKQILGESYYYEKLSNVVTNDFVYTLGQNSRELPIGFDKEKRNIVIFNSSQDEMEACGSDWNCKIYSSQNEGIRSIVEQINKQPDRDEYRIYLRVHPNLPQVQQICYMPEISIYTVIERESSVSSYLLMKSAWKVLTFGSTAGIEAAFFNIPSILLSPSLYQGFGSTYEPKNHFEVMELVLKEIKPLDSAGAVRYGFYSSYFGISKKISKMSSFLQLESINGKMLKIDKISFIRLKYLNLILKLKNKFKLLLHII